MTAHELPRGLPRGRYPAPPEVVASSQQARLKQAVYECVADQGYAATTVADIVRLAGVSRAAFYAHYTDKGDCFVAAYRYYAELLLASMGRAVADTRDPLERLVLADRAYLAGLDAEPALARVGLIEVIGAGERALAEREVVHARYVRGTVGVMDDLRRVYPQVPRLSAEVAAGLVAAGNELVVRRLEVARPLLDLESDLLYLQLSVMGLPDLARSVLAGTIPSSSARTFAQWTRVSRSPPMPSRRRTG
jgi:AcrR family transcriptional regulator